MTDPGEIKTELISFEERGDMVRKSPEPPPPPPPPADPPPTDFGNQIIEKGGGDTDDGYLTVLFWMVCIGFGAIIGYVLGAVV
jgi:hypothetical protein